MPADRVDDSYAIYSMLMPGDQFARLSPDENQSWAIAEITVNTDDRNPAVPPDGELKPPPDRPRGFQEAVEDFQVNQYTRVRLKKDDFHLTHAFALLSPDQVAALRAAKVSPAASNEEQARWAGTPGVTFFSMVYFDTRHRAALVYMNNWCAHLCASGSWIYLEKHGGQWVRQSGIVVPGA